MSEHGSPGGLVDPRTLADLGADDLSSALRPLLEDAGPLVDRLAGRRFGTWDEVLAAAADAVGAMGTDERAALLAAHPRIGADPDELARRSRSSWSEQGGDRPTPPDVAARLSELNGRYEARFGFPFVAWVAGRSRAEMIPVLEERLAGDRAAELEAGTAALLAIAGARLALLRSGGP